jgi:hypothetical protein
MLSSTEENKTMKQLLIILFMIGLTSAYSAVVTYNYTGPDARIMLSSRLFDLKDCKSGCVGEVEVDFMYERPSFLDYYNGPIELMVLLENLEPSSIEFVVTTDAGKFYAISNDPEKNVFRASDFFGGFIELQEVEKNYLKNSLDL